MDQKFSKIYENNMTFLIKRMSNLSDLSKSIIEIGVYLFSYDPCKICRLFSSSEVSCILIYKYLEIYGNVMTLINHKNYQSEVELLAN